VLRTALVTGGNRGIGKEVCRQLAQRDVHVVLASRSLTDGEEAARELRDRGHESITVMTLDVSSQASVTACATELSKRGIGIDVLVNNAAVCPDGGVLDIEDETIEAALRTNLAGPFWLARAFVPAMVRAGYGRVVNVSSGWGSFAGQLGGPVGYSATKAALNALTVKLAQEVSGDLKVNAVCPGWVRTRMGGAGATRTVEKGAETIVWLAMLSADGPNGGFFRDKQSIPW
jgi:NAD(P)-dependent dehydrogenase (short-subunit alcohol dehydrogenase family)